MSESKYYTQHQDFPLESPPKRVVSLVPSVTESLFDLAVGHTLVGRTDYCTRPADKVANIPTLGGTKNPDIAKIIALKPDLVIMNQEENRQEDATKLQDEGIAVWVTHPKTVQEAFNLLWGIMYGFDNTLMVPRVRLIEYTYDWLNPIAEEKELANPVKVFVPIWLDPLMTINRETYVHDIVRVCGATNIFADRVRQYPLSADLGASEPYPSDDPRIQGRDVRYPRVTWEEVVALQPDVILLPSEPFEFTEAHLPLFQKLDVPAAHHQRIHLVDGALLTWHGTRVAFAMNELPRIIRPSG
jgi:ABC-type Fe3+-hydroxamate transport system substrate-binding protein